MSPGHKRPVADRHNASVGTPGPPPPADMRSAPGAYAAASAAGGFGGARQVVGEVLIVPSPEVRDKRPVYEVRQLRGARQMRSVCTGSCGRTAAV